MEAEKETLEKIKLFLSCNNDSAARRAIEQYGHYRHEQALQLQQGGVSGSVLGKVETINEKIVAFVKAKLNTFKIVEDMIYVDKYKVYYNGGYVGNIKHLYDTFL